MNGEDQKRLDTIHSELLQEEITQEKRLARMEARQMVFFEKDGVCDRREKRIDGVEDRVEDVKGQVVSLRVRIAAWVGGATVIVIILQAIGIKTIIMKFVT